MNQKSVILLIGFLALISDAWILDLERAQRTIEEIDREENTAKGKSYGNMGCRVFKRGIQYNIFRAKNPYSQNKLLYFFLIDCGKPSKIGHHF